MNYYNEHDPFAAKWLRELIKAGHISQGEVDERSIQDVKPDELRAFTQCHFFAGIGVWSYALRQARWPDDREVWTGSCPCQPFSTAGKRQGFSDERHLWPTLYQLIRKCRPATFFGEQVASKDGLGWFDSVHSDLEDASYAIGAADLCAAGFGAPHIRQRLYFVADSSNVRCKQRGNTSSASVQGDGTVRTGQHAQSTHEGQISGRPEGLCGTSEMVVDTFVLDEDKRTSGWEQSLRQSGEESLSVDHAASEGLPQRTGQTDYREEARSQFERSGYTRGFWAGADWIACLDGSYRPTEPGSFPLVDGSPNRVGRLRGYGNALVAPVATAFIEAFLEVERSR